MKLGPEAGAGVNGVTFGEMGGEDGVFILRKAGFVDEAKDVDDVVELLGFADRVFWLGPAPVAEKPGNFIVRVCGK